MAWSIRDSIEKRDPNIRELRYVNRRALVEAWMDDKLVPVDEIESRYDRIIMKEAGQGHELRR